jgi:tripartite ATP-independent transporter DctP family solute receptor
MITVNWKSMIFKVCIIALVMTAILYISAMAEGEVTTLKLSHEMNTDHPYHIGSLKFAELVDKYSGGTLKVEVFPNGQLGNDEEVLELVKEGVVAFSNGIPAGDLASFYPELEVLNLPFLFESQEQMGKYLDGDVGKKFLDSMDKSGGLKGLCWHSWLFRYPISKVGPLINPEDFKGLRIRVMENNIAIDAYNALGASSTPMSFGELYTSLQTGVVDACENDLTTLYTQRFYEVTKYISLVPVLPFTAALVISKKVWNSLSLDQQQAIEKSIPETVKTTNEAYSKMEGEYLSKMKEAGIVVNEPENLQAFMNIEKKVWEKYLPQLLPFGQELAKEILGDRL